MRLGIVTYQIAADWNLAEIIEKCGRLGYEGVELRTGHRHGVEVDLSAAERNEVKKRFADSPVELVGLGSAFEFHNPDPAELAKNIAGARDYLQLAADTGAAGVKVRPNNLPDGVPEEKTIGQIGDALKGLAGFAAGLGVKLRLEVHGRKTCHPPVIRRILEAADHPNLYACWNSNLAGDLDETGSIARHFELLKDRVEIVHINQLHNEYPWRDLFARLNSVSFPGFCLAEIPASADPETVLRYYRALFYLMSGRESAA